MLKFTTDIKEAGLIFEEYGYKLAAAPISFGKNFSFLNDVNHTFPAENLLPNMNIAITHIPNKTCALDVDHESLSIPILKYLGIDLGNLIQTTMSWRGRPNRCKLLFNSPNFNLDICSLRYEEKMVLEIKGAELYSETSKENKYNYFEVLPPSIHGVTKERYEFITELVPRNNLPNLPDKLLEVYCNFKDFEKILLSKI